MGNIISEDFLENCINFDCYLEEKIAEAKHRVTFLFAQYLKVQQFYRQKLPLISLDPGGHLGGR